jgi:hypothetical protein
MGVKRLEMDVKSMAMAGTPMAGTSMATDETSIGSSTVNARLLRHAFLLRHHASLRHHDRPRHDRRAPLHPCLVKVTQWPYRVGQGFVDSFWNSF